MITTGFIAGGVLILALVAWSVWLMRKGGDVARLEQREDDDELRNEARVNRQRLDDADRKRLRSKYRRK